MNYTTYNLSIEEILKQIYALGALRSVMNVNRPAGEQVPLLHRDRREALVEAVTGAANEAGTVLNASSVSTTDGDTIITMVLPSGGDPLTTSRALSQLIAYKVLAVVNTGYDNATADSYTSMAEDILTNLLIYLHYSPSMGHRITPCY